MILKHMDRRFLFWTPLIIFFLLVLIFWRGLFIDPHKIPSALIGQPVPHFLLPSLHDEHTLLDDKILQGKISLVNVWATWCAACQDEHATLMKIAKYKTINLIGFNYKDDRPKAKQWLAHLGNPYQTTLFDKAGSVAIDWGVYGTPETFLIDRKGVIRYRYVGAINQVAWEGTLLPLINMLQGEK